MTVNKAFDLIISPTVYHTKRQLVNYNIHTFISVILIYMVLALDPHIKKYYQLDLFKLFLIFHLFAKIKTLFIH